MQGCQLEKHQTKLHLKRLERGTRGLQRPEKKSLQTSPKSDTENNLAHVVMRLFVLSPVSVPVCGHCEATRGTTAHLCSGILVRASHQLVHGHVLGHRHVAELEGKYLPSGRRIWKRHVDDAVEATWTHQSLRVGKNKKKSSILGLSRIVLGPRSVLDLMEMCAVRTLWF